MNAEHDPVIEVGARPHRFAIDWTINFTNVVTFAMGCVTVAGLYYGLDKRVAKIEDLAPIEATQRKEKDAAVQRSLTDLSTDIKEVKAAVEKVSRAIEVQTAVAEAKEKKR